MTLVGIPKGWLPFEKAEIYGKAWDCIEGTQAILFTLQNHPPTLSTSKSEFQSHGFKDLTFNISSRGALSDLFRLCQPRPDRAFHDALGHGA